MKDRTMDAAGEREIRMTRVARAQGDRDLLTRKVALLCPAEDVAV